MSLSAILATSMLFASAMPVFAATNEVTVDNEANSYTLTTTVNLAVTAEMLGQDIVVTVPSVASISILDDYRDGSYRKPLPIICKGAIQGSSDGLIIASPLSFTMTNESGTELVASAGCMGGFVVPLETTKETLGIPELTKNIYVDKFAKENMLEGSVTHFCVSVAKANLRQIGNYTGTINYYIGLSGDSIKTVMPHEYFE